jgi:hypothetical protein
MSSIKSFRYDYVVDEPTAKAASSVLDQHVGLAGVPLIHVIDFVYTACLAKAVLLLVLYCAQKVRDRRAPMLSTRRKKIS